MFDAIRNRLKTFRAGVEGNVSIEMVFFVPLIITVLAATFALHDAFRQKSLNTKASYTISDAISRETDPLDDSYLDGMLDLLEYLTNSSGPYSIRVTLVHYDADEDHHTAEWSQVRGTFEPLDDTALAELRTEIPVMLDNERVILVETETEYLPPLWFNKLPMDRFYTLGVTRPRFAPKITWAES